MSTIENRNPPSAVYCVCNKILLLTALSTFVIALCLASPALAQTVPQIGLKFGINGLAGLQNTNVGALQPGDLAGAPGYAQTNWNVLGYRGENALGLLNPAFNVLDSSGANSGVTIQCDGANVWSVANGGTPADQLDPDKNLM